MEKFVIVAFASVFALLAICATIEGITQQREETKRIIATNMLIGVTNTAPNQ